MKALFALLLFLFTFNSYAELTQEDWKSVNDNLILRDSNTGLDWLHLSQTQGSSINELMGQLFGNTEVKPLVGAFAEFRYASTDEVSTLYANLGLTADWVLSADNWVGANIAYQTLGITGTSADGSVSEQLGIALDNSNTVYTPRIVTRNFLDTAKALVLADIQNFDYSDTNSASYLVRNIPAPPPPPVLELMSSNPAGVTTGIYSSALGSTTGQITYSQLLNGGFGIPSDDAYNYTTLFDFIVTGITGNAQIQITLSSPIPANAVYRKYDPNLSKWITLVPDSNNLVASAAKVSGICPTAGSSAYSHLNGMRIGDECLQLTLEDNTGINNGIYDHDITAGTIADPGGVATATDSTTTTTVSADAGGGGGSLSLFSIIILMFWGALFRVIKTLSL